MAKMPLRHRKTPMWSHGHVFLIFLEFFEILVPISYLHLKKNQNKNIGKNEKTKKLMPLWKKGPKCHKRDGKPQCDDMAIYFFWCF